jgi:hypothetical protein
MCSAVEGSVCADPHPHSTAGQPTILLKTQIVGWLLAEHGGYPVPERHRVTNRSD